MADKKNIGIRQVRNAAEKEDGFLYDSVNRNQQIMAQAIRKLEKRMLNTLKLIETDESGRVESAKLNLKQAQKVHRQMIKDFEQTYGEAAREVVSNFDETDKFIEKSWSYLNEAADYTSYDKELMKNLKSTVYNQFEEFGRDAQQRIQEQMYAHITGGADYASLISAIQGTLRGHKDARGRPMSVYAKQFAFDATMDYHNHMNTSKAEDLGIYHYLYVGDIIGSSRPFCRRRAGKVYTKGQINSWDRFQWKGKRGPAMQYRGGYNCRHHWRPVRPEWLDGKTQVDISDWRVGPSARQAKPAHLEKTPGTRGWNEYTKEERAHLSRIHTRLKGGRKLTPGAKQIKWYKKSLSDAEKAAFVEALEKEGFDVPEILKPGTQPPVGPLVKPKPKVKPKTPKPKPVAPKPPVPKPEPVVSPPKPKPPAPKPKVKPKTPPAPAFNMSKLSSVQKTRVTSMRRLLIKGENIGASPKRVKWWEDNLSKKDREAIVRMWEAEGIRVHSALKKGLAEKVTPRTPYKPKVTPKPKVKPTAPKPKVKPTAEKVKPKPKVTPTAKPEPVVVQPPKPKVTPKPKVPDNVKNNPKMLKKRISQLQKNISESISHAERKNLKRELSETRKQFAKVGPVKQVEEMRKQTLRELLYRRRMPETEKLINNMYEGTRHLPFEFIQDMQDEGLRVHLSREGGAFFSKRQRLIQFSTEDIRDWNASTCAHEFAHVLDARMGSRGKGFGDAFGYWHDDSPLPVTANDSAKYRKWYKNQHTGRMGTKGSGDNRYTYQIGNWIDDYEGRVYDAQNVAEEWWSLGAERYHDGFKAAGKHLNFTPTDYKETLALIDKAKKGPLNKWDSLQLKTRINAAKVWTGEISADDYLESFLDNPRLTIFEKQKEMYSEFAQFQQDFYRKYRKQERPLEVENLTNKKPKKKDMGLLQEIANFNMDKPEK